MLEDNPLPVEPVMPQPSGAPPVDVPPPVRWPPPPPPPLMYMPAPSRVVTLRVWPVFVAVVAILPVMIGVWTVAIIACMAIETIRHGSAAAQNPDGQKLVREPLLLIPVMALISLGNAGIAVCGGWLSPLNIRARLALGPGSAGWGALGLLSLGTLAVGMMMVNLIELLGINSNQGADEIISSMISKSSPVELGILLVVVSFFPAVAEELLMRGYVQTRLVARWGSAIGIGISGLLFGLIHMDVVQTPVMIFVGAYLGWAAYRTGSTRTSIFCHLINNGTACVLAATLGGSGDVPSGNSAGSHLIGLAFGTVVFGVCTWIVNRIVPKRVALTVAPPVNLAMPL